MPIDQNMNAAEVAQLLRCTPQFVYYLAKRNELPHFRIGDRVLFPRRLLLRAIRERTVTGKGGRDAAA
jgi:excisionase family DNA binding protein